MQVAVLKKPERKVRAWPFVAFFVFLLLLILPVVIIYGMAYDANTKNVSLQENVTLKTVGNRVMVDSLDNAVDHQKMEVSVSENDMDNILHVGLKKAVGESPVVKKAYINIKENRYTFFIDLDGTLIKSRIKIFTLLRESEDKTAFIFDIKDITLGQISGLNGPVKDIVQKYVNTETINTFVNKANLSITFDPNSMSFTYKKIDVIEDIQKLAMGAVSDLYFDIIDTMLKDNLVTFDTKTNNFMDAYVDLEPLETNDLVTDDADHLRVEADEVSDQCRENLLSLVQEKKIATDDATLIAGFKFLFGGWNYLLEEEQNLIKDVNMSTIGIDNLDEYKGFDLMDSEAKLFEKMKTKVNVQSLIQDHSLDLCSLSEKDINDYVAGRNIVGYTTLLHRQDGDEYKINFITIDNFYMNFYSPTDGERAGKNVAEMVCKINVNGYHTSLTFDTLMEGDTIEDNKMVFNIQNIRFGNVNAENLTQQFFGIIFDALNKNSNDSALSADKEKHTITLDFNEIINYTKGEVQKQLDASGKTADLDTAFGTANINFALAGDSRAEDGDMILTLKSPIVVS